MCKAVLKQDNGSSLPLYVCPKDSPELYRQLLFRDYLRKHKDARNEYADLKQSLAELYRHDIDSYVDGKHVFVEDIIKKAQEELI